MDQQWCPRRAKPPTPSREAPRDTKKEPKWPPLASFWPPFGAPVASLGLPLALLGPPLAAQWPLLVSLWLPSPLFGHPVASLWLPEAPLGLPFGCPVTKSKPKLYQNGPQNPRNPARDRKQREDDAEICTKNERMNTYALYTQTPPGPERVYCRRQLRFNPKSKIKARMGTFFSILL